MAKKKKGQRTLEPISQNYSGPFSETELQYLQRKISCAGEMKSKVRRFLDWWDWQSEDDTTGQGVILVEDLRKAMEDYLNCVPATPPHRIGLVIWPWKWSRLLGKGWFA